MENTDTEATDLHGMLDIATSHFESLLGTPMPREHALNLTDLELPVVDTEALELPFSEQEI
jgi:hypothetical protein